MEQDLLNIGFLERNRYIDVFVEYAKTDQDDILIKIAVTNNLKERISCHLNLKK